MRIRYLLKFKSEKQLIAAVEEYVATSVAWGRTSNPFTTDVYGNVNFRRSAELAARDAAFGNLRRALFEAKK